MHAHKLTHPLVYMAPSVFTCSQAHMHIRAPSVFSCSCTSSHTYWYIGHPLCLHAYKLMHIGIYRAPTEMLASSHTYIGLYRAPAVFTCSQAHTHIGMYRAPSVFTCSQAHTHIVMYRAPSDMHAYTHIGIYGTLCVQMLTRSHTFYHAHSSMSPADLNLPLCQHDLCPWCPN